MKMRRWRISREPLLTNYACLSLLCRFAVACRYYFTIIYPDAVGGVMTLELHSERLALL